MFWVPPLLVSQINFIEMTSPPPPKKTKQTNKGKKKERERMDEENMNNAELNVNQIEIWNGH